MHVPAEVVAAIIDEHEPHSRERGVGALSEKYGVSLYTVRRIVNGEARLLEDGSVDLGAGKFTEGADPTPEELQAELLAIRAGWTPEQEQSRRSIKNPRAVIPGSHWGPLDKGETY